LQWREAEPAVRRVVDAWWRDASTAGLACTCVDATPHRTVQRLSHQGTSLLVKHYRSATGPHRWRERTKHAIGAAASDREWRGLRWLAQADVAAPRALGRARTPAGDTLLVLEWIDGPTLWDRLADDPADQRALLMETADAVAALHAAGLAHGDLHPGNLLIGERGPVFVDLQRARRARPGGRLQQRDLGLLDYSLRQLDVSRTDRLRVIQRALAGAGPTVAHRPDRARAVVAMAERTSRNQARVRARHGRPPAGGSHWSG
jgi:tRNA A-37 threonylcarbamoyl transferase component Bud32